jgi:hypothetical protein
LSYETRVTWSVNRLHVDNLEPSGIRGDLGEISVDVNTKTMNVKKKNSNYYVFGWHEIVAFIPV